MKFWLLSPLLLSLVACGEQELTVNQVCEEKPGICTDLNDDSHCKLERRHVIMGRYDEQKMPSDKNKYKLLIDFEKYSKCIELASGIEHIKLKEKKTTRVNGYLTSLKEIKRLNDETVSSLDPNLLHYHWTRNQSESHLAKFLQAEQKKELETPELQIALASYYMKRNPQKTIDILHHALSLYPADAEVDPEIYTALTTIYYKQKKFPQSYHWALLAENAGVQRIEFKNIKAELAQQKIETDSIEDIADSTIESIQTGQFKVPAF
ncbi:MAG TPA: DUF2989 domain-containing protein [Rheinheimera sp.]|uniref:DUF2989 domain-containing protein n=1 Tax=Rheinheimera sp. TaxID=1869214 RepID=UPI000EC04B95|nr:DUF2989 domain-containing protein [Rheinheimera sp.]HCU64348.1 DUF2989 domain-containing protein [Rheinheimera sp.]